MIDNIIDQIQNDLRDKITVDQKKATMFFKTSKGEYAEHDLFLGVTIPNIRKIAKKFNSLNFKELQILISSKYNEERFLALVILVRKFEQANKELQKQIFDFYMNNIAHVNNWNLVDVSAHLIIGAYLMNKPKHILIELAQSDNMWRRRIAIVATWQFIRNGNTEWTFKIARILLKDKHDLIHKAVGWMLREAGKCHLVELEKFLGEFAGKMPRTMLGSARRRIAHIVAS